MKPVYRFSFVMLFLLGALFFGPEPSAATQTCNTICRCENTACNLLCEDDDTHELISCNDRGFCNGHPNCSWIVG